MFNIMRKIHLPLIREDITKLKAGDEVLLSGIIYTARDQAHKRLCEYVKQGKKLPIALKGNIIYYCGPTPARKNMPIGACGPTTSKRMDEFTPLLLSKGIIATIGKGSRSKQVVDALKKNKAVYFVAPAGAGAYLSQRVKKAKLIAFNDLGPEAIYELEISDFPVIVAIDSNGKSYPQQ